MTRIGRREVLFSRKLTKLTGMHPEDEINNVMQLHVVGLSVEECKFCFTESYETNRNASGEIRQGKHQLQPWVRYKDGHRYLCSYRPHSTQMRNQTL
jgi:hypothetical protein